MLSFQHLVAIEMDNFSSHLKDPTLIRTPLHDDFSLAIDQFSSTFQSIMDNDAPIVRRSITFRHNVTWFIDEIKAAKTKGRKLER